MHDLQSNKNDLQYSVTRSINLQDVFFLLLYLEFKTMTLKTQNQSSAMFTLLLGVFGPSQYTITLCWLLFATKYQVDQVAIRLQSAGPGSDTPQQQLQFSRLP